MSADNPITPPSPAPAIIDTRTRIQKIRAWVVPICAVLAPIISAIAAQQGCPKTIQVVQEVEKVIQVAAPGELSGGGEPTPAFGWIEDKDQIEKNLDGTKTLQFAATPAGKASLGDEDTFLYRATRKAAGKPAPWYPNINQGSVGCCVGAGSKHACDVVQATAILNGAAFEWKPASAEVIYAGSRVDVGGGRLRGDGSSGTWAMQYLRDKGGIAPMEKVGSYDLTVFSPSLARKWGATGAPAEVKAVAKQHPVKGAALVTSAADVKRALMQGYPIAVCSDVGFNNRDGSVGTRDKDGFCTARGVWPHCMCLLAWRNGSRPGALCLNSWGDKAHGGPVWPEDMPVAAFWIDEAVVDRMVREGDSFALSDVQGFPKRVVPLDWNVRMAQPRESVEVFVRNRLSRELQLAW